jgi:hypothetical protein
VIEDKKKSLPWYKQIELKQAEKEKKVCDAYGDLERDLSFSICQPPTTRRVPGSSLRRV